MEADGKEVVGPVITVNVGWSEIPAPLVVVVLDGESVIIVLEMTIIE